MSLTQEIKRLVERSRIVNGTTTANWNTGTATSGQPGADLFTYGTARQWYRLGDSYLVLTGFNAAAEITARCYMYVAGMMRYCGSADWLIADIPTDGELAWMIWFWEIQVYGPIRVEVYSDTLADDGFTASWEYRVKGW